MSRNVDRLSDIMDLPSLLSATISAAAAQGTAAGTANYAAALDLRSHIRRLHLLYPKSKLVGEVFRQCEEKMQDMAGELIKSLRGQNVKLAAGIRVIGWLRRVLPDLDDGSKGGGGAPGNTEGIFGALFLVCRLATLVNMLAALEPLRDLADQEIATRKAGTINGKMGKERSSTTASWSSQQTERYLKRYIEIFREQSFAIVSMYKSIFPSSASASASAPSLAPASSTSPKQQLPQQQQQQQPPSNSETTNSDDNTLFSPPSALSTFPLHLLSLLTETLQQYLPNVYDKSSRESLLTQVLYCAGSLGRLGGDFSLVVAQLGTSLSSVGEHDDDDEEDEEEHSDDEGLGGDEGRTKRRRKGDGDDGDEEGGVEEWVEVMKKHRELAGRLELLASGVGLGSAGKGGGGGGGAAAAVTALKA